MSGPLTRPSARRRRAPHFDHVPYTRRVKGSKLQIRWWLTGWGSLNLELYEPELAVVVRRKLIPRTRHRPDTPLGIWGALVEVLDEMRRAGVPGLPDVLPPYVRRADGGGFRALVRKGGRKLELPGPFTAPADAHHAMLELLRREFPGWARADQTRRPGRKARTGGADAAADVG
ncbi:hypothetical protein R5W23_005482 [Gemmata sp. JC673]|uniref:Uncharacterized protein n=1 Tax=Gemmata algarum TaxID=2975278 RepID=A0ABU5EXM3_9BACT|nr:hypothetical protein [Gemmata algarum]MDY3558389.1 hypothetical protein [Gemmata algarum]